MLVNFVSVLRYLLFDLRRHRSNKADVAERKQVYGVGANRSLIAVVGCSVSELDCRHTVHEMNCVWVAQGAEVFFILFSSFYVSHQANISVEPLTLFRAKDGKGKDAGLNMIVTHRPSR